MRRFFLTFIALCSLGLRAEEAPNPDAQCWRAYKLSFDENGIYTAKTVKNLFEALIKEPMCDEDAFADGISTAVVKALLNDFTGVIDFANAKADAGNFVLKHIDGSADEQNLKKLLGQEKLCPARNKICTEIIGKTKAVLKELSVDPSFTCDYDKLEQHLKSDAKYSNRLYELNGTKAAYIEGCSWESLTEAIEHGNYRIFDLTARNADAGIGEELAQCMDNSIFFVPEQALTRKICIPETSEITDPDYIELLNAVLNKVKTVTSPGLAKAKGQCIKEIRKELKQTKAHYQKACVQRTRPDQESSRCHKTNFYEKYVHPAKI